MLPQIVILRAGLCALVLFLIASCDSETTSNVADNGGGTSLPPPQDSPGSCHLNIQDRLDAGLGYCYETSFQSFDGTDIATQVFVPHPEKLQAIAGVPVGGSDPGFAPLIVHGHGYGGSKAEDFSPPGMELDRQVSLDLWEQGNWVISFTERGFGGIDGSEIASGGQIGLMAPDKEGWDFVRLVDWAICHLRENAPFENATAVENGDPEYDNCGLGGNSDWGQSLIRTDAGTRLTSFDDDVAIGTVGYSYGGAFQFNAQSVDPRVDAMLPMGTWHDLRTSLHPNDVPKTAWITIMTAFGSPIPEVGGGNGQPLPDIIVDANAEANGANNKPEDLPYNKARQVSVANANILAPNGAVAFCDGHQAEYAAKYADPDGEPHDLTAANKPAHAVTTRAARADLFMIQGYGDTLFPFGEGYDNARCFEDAGRDVYYLGETSGHPLPAIGPANYAGSDTSMYLDEIIHCGVDGNNAPVRYNTRELGVAWFADKLRGQTSFSSILPSKVCITQVNADTALVLDTADPFFNNGTTNTSENAYKWSREGAVFDSVADVPVGGTQFALAATTVTTGPGSLGQGMDMDPRIAFAELLSVTTPQVMAGIPTAQITVTRANPVADEIFFAGIAVQRCQSNPIPTQDPQSCESNSPELLHFQAMPIRAFPNDEAGTATVDYPRDDPRSFVGEPSKGNFYKVRWGENPQDPSKGRLHGVSARLYPGDKVGLLLMPEHPTYTTIFSSTLGQVTVEGTVELPLLTAPNSAPVNVPSYVIQN